MAGTKTRDEWAELVAKFDLSEERIKRFCAKHRVAPKTFARWRWRLRKERKGRRPRGRSGVRLVAVDVKPAPTIANGNGVFQIALGDIELRIEVGTDIGYVSALVGALRSRC